MTEVKRELRSRMAAVRAAVPEASRILQAEAASLLAEEQVLRPLRASKSGGRLNVFSYVSFRDEPPTLPLIRNCWSKGDRVLVPRITGPTSLELYESTDEGDWKPGTWGIPEPAEHLAWWASKQYKDIDLVIVPGLAYDLRGGRIGFGGGYYDRFLAQLGKPGAGTSRPLIGALVLQEQLISDIPMEEHDFRLDVLFTSSGVIRISNP